MGSPGQDRHRLSLAFYHDDADEIAIHRSGLMVAGFAARCNGELPTVFVY
jgi:hypothetical protein